MGEIVEIQVCKGLTKHFGEKEWQRIEYKLTARLDCTEELNVARAQLEAVLDAWLAQALQRKEPQREAEPSVKNKENAQELFPENLKRLVSFEEAGNYLIIKPAGFLGSENFAKIADIVKTKGGEYVSSGKNSHFRIPVKTS
jgi:hypothetical protein